MKKFLHILKYIEYYVYKLYKNFDLETEYGYNIKTKANKQK